MENGIESFKKLGLSKKVLDVIKEMGFDSPSEIQENAIPQVVSGKDVIGHSSTGSGKTLAFGSGVLERVKADGKIQALILTPTRELANQIKDSLGKFSKYLDMKIICVYGGVGMAPQERELQEADVVVGTPGRTLDHLRRGNFDPRNIDLLILDEADRMLEMGMIEDVEKIIDYCPKKRQTLLFSATITGRVEGLAEKYMKNPIYIRAEPHVDASKLNQVFYDVPIHKKFSLLVHLLKEEKSGLVMVFCSTRRNTDLVAKNLKRYGLHASAIHGGLTQNRRNKIMEKFNSGDLLILVCTDVAARGLDIDGVSHVYNYDSPGNSDEYTHRIGRTARAGKEGKAISLISQKDFRSFRNILERLDVSVKQEELPEFEELDAKFNVSRGGGDRRGRGGGRGGRRGPRRDSRGPRKYDRGNDKGKGDRKYGGGRGRRNDGFSNDKRKGKSYGGRNKGGGRRDSNNRSGKENLRGRSRNYDKNGSRRRDSRGPRKYGEQKGRSRSNDRSRKDKRSRR